MKKRLVLLLVCAVGLAFAAPAAPQSENPVTGLVAVMARDGDAAALAMVKKMDLDLKKQVETTAPNGTKFKFSLLTLAIMHQCPKTAVYLVEQGADLNAVTTPPRGTPETPLSAALSQARKGGKADYALARLLVERGADVNGTVTRQYRDGTFQESMLALALMAGVRERRYDLDFLNLLLDKGAAPAAKTCLRSKDAKHPQSLFCLTGREGAEIALRLVRSGAEGTPSKTVREFIAEKPNRKALDAKLRYSMNIFDLDVWLGNLGALIAAGADPNQPYMLGEIAKAAGYPALEYLKMHGADLRRYGAEAACWAANRATIRYLHEQGVPLDTVISFNAGRDRKTPLSSAVSRGSIEVAQYLLENGVSANSPGVADAAAWQIRFGFGSSPEKRRKLVRLMLDHGLRFSAEQLEKFRKDPQAAAFAGKLGIAL